MSEHDTTDLHINNILQRHFPAQAFKNTFFVLSFANKQYGTLDKIAKDDDTCTRLVFIPATLQNFFRLRRFAVREALARFNNLRLIQPDETLSTDQFYVYQIPCDIEAVNSMNLHDDPRPNRRSTVILSDLAHMALVNLIHDLGIGPEVQQVLKLRLGVDWDALQYLFLQMEDNQ